MNKLLVLLATLLIASIALSESKTNGISNTESDETNMMEAYI